MLPLKTSPFAKMLLAFRPADLYLEGVVVWTVLTIITAGTLLLPFLADPQFILQHTPTCISQRQFQAECGMCGMTRAFIEIVAGRFGRARQLNGGSLLLYTAFLVNFALYLRWSLPVAWRLVRTGALRHVQGP